MPTQTQTKTKTKAQLAEDKRALEARRTHNADRKRELIKLVRSTTQGEWLSICRQLDLSRETISEDENLMLLAAAWVKDKRKHGTSSFDVLLELTDRGLLEFHGYQLAPEDDDDDDADGAA